MHELHLLSSLEYLSVNLIKKFHGLGHTQRSEKLTIDLIIFAIGKPLLSKIGINERDLFFFCWVL